MYCLSKFCHMCMSLSKHRLVDIKACNLQNVKDQLDFCIPELNRTEPEMVCRTCLKSLKKYYKFKFMVIRNTHMLNKYKTKLSDNIDTETTKSARSELYISALGSNADLTRKVLSLKSKLKHTVPENKLLDVDKKLNSSPANKKVKEGQMVINYKDDFLGFKENEQIKLSTIKRKKESNEVDKVEDVGKNNNTNTENPVNSELGFDVNDIKFSINCVNKMKNKTHAFKAALAANINNKETDGNKFMNSINKKGKIYTCIACGKAFAKRSRFLQHAATHKTEKKFKCTVCATVLTKKPDIDKHLLTHTDQFQLCSICNKLFSKKSDLGIHLLTHAVEKYKCNKCDKHFSGKESFEEHQLLHLATTTTSTKEYDCKVCMKICSSASTLKQHSLTHSDLKLFKCGKCDKSFSNKTNLARHGTSHTH